MARLPTVGNDNNQWGNLLNEFLNVSHREDGTLRNIISVTNVRDFGAKGDGVSDDTTAVDTARKAALAGGNALFFPPGIYLVNGIRRRFLYGKFIKIAIDMNTLVMAMMPVPANSGVNLREMAENEEIWYDPTYIRRVIRLTHPDYNAINHWPGFLRPFNRDMTRVMILENPGPIAGRGTVWGYIDDLIAVSGGSIDQYIDVTHKIPTEAQGNAQGQDIHWSQIVGEENVVYTINRSSQNVIRINVDTGDSRNIASYGPCACNGSEVARGWCADGTFFVAHFPDDSSDIYKAKVAKGGATINVVSGTTTVYGPDELPLLFSTQGARFPMWGSAHADRSPDRTMWYFYPGAMGSQGVYLTGPIFHYDNSLEDKLNKFREDGKIRDPFPYYNNYSAWSVNNDWLYISSSQGIHPAVPNLAAYKKETFAGTLPGSPQAIDQLLWKVTLNKQLIDPWTYTYQRVLRAKGGAHWKISDIVPKTAIPNGGGVLTFSQPLLWSALSILITDNNASASGIINIVGKDTSSNLSEQITFKGGTNIYKSTHAYMTIESIILSTTTIAEADDYILIGCVNQLEEDNYHSRMRFSASPDGHWILFPCTGPVPTYEDGQTGWAPRWKTIGVWIAEVL